MAANNLADTGAVTTPMRASLLTIALGAAVLAVSCGASEPAAEPAPAQATEETTVMTDPMPTLVGERTIVFPAGIDLSGSSDFTTHSPTPAEVNAAITTIASAPELDWAGEHTRFVSGRNDDGTVTIVVDLACDIEPVGGAAAIVAMQNLSTVGDGGDCYGFAVLSRTGELLRWGVNGQA